MIPYESRCETDARIIRSKADNEEPLRTLEELLQKGDAITPAESERIGLLNVLVEASRTSITRARKRARN